ncbi:transposase [Streptomyces europaeiscabiei]|uniref:transposase n=1 Tax=Streptomyces europaeiscabiei TaxID=146819 RepID=UPI0029B3E5C1|nr:transposase [Streptomyces europaeiscabiei]MDX3695984.1 transposase [Streptomyces europaeiscabiei]
MGKKKPRPRRSFTPEFKAEIVELCRRDDRSVGQIAKDFDLTETAVRDWVKQAELDAAQLTYLPEPSSKPRESGLQSVDGLDEVGTWHPASAQPSGLRIRFRRQPAPHSGAATRGCCGSRAPIRRAGRVLACSAGPVPWLVKQKAYDTAVWLPALHGPLLNDLLAGCHDFYGDLVMYPDGAAWPCTAGPAGATAFGGCRVAHARGDATA